MSKTAPFRIRTERGVMAVILTHAIPVGLAAPGKRRPTTLYVNPRTDMGALLSAKGWCFA